MTGQNRIFDDFSRLMTNAMGVAQGARDEAETAFKGWVDRWLAERDFVTREEFEAVREMAIKARTENAELRAMVLAMQGGASPERPGTVRPVSEAEAPASANAGSAAGGPQGDAAPRPVSEVEAPASSNAGAVDGDEAQPNRQG